MQNALLEHSAILSNFIKLTCVIKIFVLSYFEWPFYTGFTVFRELDCKLSLYLCRLISLLADAEVICVNEII